jgi:hypothetical protein
MWLYRWRQFGLQGIQHLKGLEDIHIKICSGHLWFEQVCVPTVGTCNV